MSSALPASLPNAPRGAVFVSYASQDVQAVERIAEALRAAGLEVWFDKDELVGGDAWDQKIRRQIKECALFVPVISANTNARAEGYFRLEWKLAVDRSHLMADDAPFLFPVVIDDTTDAAARVPDKFREVQWTRLNVKDTPETLAARMAKVLGRQGKETPPAVAANSVRDSTRRSPSSLIGIIATIGGVAIGLVFALRPLWSPSRRAAVKPTAVAPVSPVAPPSAEFPRDPELKRARQLIQTLDAIAEDLLLADDLVKPLLAQRPNDPEVVTVAAEVGLEIRARGFDLSETRRAAVQRLAERAVQLAPENPVALGTLGRHLMIIAAQPSRAEELLRGAIARQPDEPRHYRNLYQLYARSKAEAKAQTVATEMVARFPDDALVRYDIARMAKDANQPVEAERGLDETLARAPVAAAMMWKAWFALEQHGDPVAMKSWLDRVPERQRINARFAYVSSVHATVTGATASARKVLGDLPDEWMTDFDYYGPKALLIGELFEREGRRDLARLQYEAALAIVQRERARAPTDLFMLQPELRTLLRLGRLDEARAVSRALQQTLVRPYRWTINTSWWNGPIRMGLLLGDREMALTLLQEGADDEQARRSLRHLFRLDPEMAPWRDAPEIVALLKEPAN